MGAPAGTKFCLPPPSYPVHRLSISQGTFRYGRTPGPGAGVEVYTAEYLQLYYNDARL